MITQAMIEMIENQYGVVFARHFEKRFTDMLASSIVGHLDMGSESVDPRVLFMDAITDTMRSIEQDISMEADRRIP